MSQNSSQPYPTRPAFATIQPSTTSDFLSSSSSSTSLASASPASISTYSTSTSTSTSTMPNSQQQQSFFGALGQQQPRQQAQRHPSFEYRPNRDGAGQSASETTAYLNQAALLAEAAKRAQLAVVMRDIEGMEL